MLRCFCSRPARPSRPVIGLCAFTWKPMATSGVSARKRLGIDWARIALGVAAEQAVARTYGSSRRPAPRIAGRCRKFVLPAIAPVRPGAGIEQHGHDREVDADGGRRLRRWLATRVSAPAPPSGRGRLPRSAASANERVSTKDWRSAWPSRRASPAPRPRGRWDRRRTSSTARPRHISASAPPARGSPRACEARQQRVNHSLLVAGLAPRAW